MCLDWNGIGTKTLHSELIVDPIERKDSQISDDTQIDVHIRILGRFRKGTESMKMFSLVDADTATPTILKGFADKKKNNSMRVPKV
jgi:hypothetical protein